MTVSSVGPNGTRWSPICLGADQAADEGEPASEHDRAAALGLGGVEVGPAVAQRSEVERVDAGGQPVADRERFDPERAAQLFVLVLRVTEDQHPVAEVEHPQDERLGGGRLAAAGFAEAEHVGVGDRHVVAEHPAERVGVEAAARQLVDAHLGAGGRQPGGGDQRPQHGRLVGGHPPRRHLRREPPTSRRPRRSWPRIGAWWNRFGSRR